MVFIEYKRVEPILNPLQSYHFVGVDIRSRHVRIGQRTVRIQVGFPFAKLLRNETQNFSFFAHQFCAKKQQFAQLSQKIFPVCVSCAKIAQKFENFAQKI